VASQGDWQLVRRFSDQVSGATLERPGLRRALSEAGAGSFDLLLVYRVDRRARSVRGLAQILETSTSPAWRFARRPSRSTPPPQRGG
jgi:site-specific DNA recombinase